jgi:hypothetical protein
MDNQFGHVACSADRIARPVSPFSTFRRVRSLIGVVLATVWLAPGGHPQPSSPTSTVTESQIRLSCRLSPQAEWSSASRAAGFKYSTSRNA